MALYSVVSARRSALLLMCVLGLVGCGGNSVDDPPVNSMSAGETFSSAAVSSDGLSSRESSSVLASAAVSVSSLSLSSLSNSSSSHSSQPVVPPPYSGTVYLDPNIITADDPTSFEAVSYTGQTVKSVYDGRDGSTQDLSVYQFNLAFDDGITISVHVMPAIGDLDAARAAVNRIAKAVGQVPTQLRQDVALIHIFAGDGRANAASWDNLITVYAGANIGLARDGFLEELFIHEASHVSIDPNIYIDGRWLAAQENDPTFISNYGRDHFRSEDVAESVMAYLAIRYKPNRISADMDRTIHASIPHRIAFFDKVLTNVYPLVDESARVKSRLSPQFLSEPLASDNVIFEWDKPDNATLFDLVVGSKGFGSSDIRASSVVEQTQLAVAALPSDGSPVFARLWSQVDNQWRYNDYRLAGYAPNVLTAGVHTPVPESRFASEVVTFEWDRPNGATEFDLIVGTQGAGSDDIRSSSIFNDTQFKVNHIPAGSGEVYVRLWTNKGDWRYEDFTYQADFGNAELISPVPGSFLMNDSVTFQWQASRSAASFDILVGTTGPGSNNIRATQVLQDNEVTVSGLPTDGSPIYVRLWTYKKDWQYVDYRFN